MPWRTEIADALADFQGVAHLAAAPLAGDGLNIEYLPAPHRPPSSLPFGRMAIYGFWWDGSWLKIGKAGANSNARYVSQHYNPGSAMSTLAASLLADSGMASAAGLDAARPGDWIKAQCCRANILVPERLGKPFLSLLEAFLHVRLKPRYEG
jgi:hypothetical protein